MASTMVPKAVLRNLERTRSNFLWGVQGTSRTHWVSWKNICCPIGEGGLGILSLAETYVVLQAKLMWSVMCGETLWAKYARSKYFLGDEMCVHAQASPLWRSIKTYFPIICSQSRWVVGSGEKKFWTANWLGERLSGPFQQMVILIS